MPFYASVSLSVKWGDFTCSLWFFPALTIHDSLVLSLFLTSLHLPAFHYCSIVCVYLCLFHCFLCFSIFLSSACFLSLSLSLTICHQVLPVRQLKKKFQFPLAGKYPITSLYPANSPSSFRLQIRHQFPKKPPRPLYKLP